jgi:DNA-binding NarL/FixJ family response regulator
VVGIGHDGLEGLTLARTLHPDVVLMDIQMPHCDGLAATRLIKAELPDVQIVMLTMSALDEDLFEAIKSGATGYLPKNLDAEQFFDLLLGLEQGEAPMPRALATRILHEFAQQSHFHTPDAAGKGAAEVPANTQENDPETAVDMLTSRQLEALQLIVAGYSNKEIAEALVITERTVKYHMREILQKLHLRNRAQVVAYALQRGLIDHPELQ